MYYTYRALFLLVICLLPCAIFGQQLDHVQGEIIVQMRSGASSIHAIANEMAQFHGRRTAIQAKQCLSEDMHIWVLNFDFTKIHERRLLAALRRNRLVQSAQLNHFIQFRKVPNDPDFLRQWEYINNGANGGNMEADLDADLAWDITTGGVTANGDTIVLAALDNGVDLDHEDLVDNIWRNHAEIPDNGIDDDNNGYVDDYFGIDANIENGVGDVGRGGDHGTSVMGVMGATGNNGIGVTGVNWDVKLMMIKTDFETTEAILIRGFGYPLALRKKYNETNGQEGAFVVATNNSWGVDNAFPEDAPIWCSLYDSLGAAGILSTGATANAEINVDAFGDLPTTCPSDFMIGVTSLNRAGEKVRSAGFGKENIDIGAFGERVYNVAINNDYELTSGTSLATPQVAGAIGLLYSAPCRNFSNLTKANPAQAALLVREYILNGAKPNPLIDTLVATGGQLNLNNSLQLLMQACGSCPNPLAVTTSNIIDVSAEISWISSEVETKGFLRYRPTGSKEWIVIEDVRSPFVLSDLSACTNYEFQLNSECMDEESGYVRTFTFKTDGCCETPTNIRVEAVEENSVRIAWDALFAAQRYEVRFNPLGSNDLNVITVANNFIDLNDLVNCTDYEYQIRTICADTTTAFSPVQTVTTRGCGACRDAEYCVSRGDEDFEWISRVELNTLNNSSGSEKGYGDYMGLSTDLNTGQSYPLTIDIGYESFPFAENIQVWIDLNQNGIFEDSTENLVNLDEDVTDTYSQDIILPFDATPGLTRMRITIKWREVDPTKPTPCSSFDYGEVEDYCINIVPSAAPCIAPIFEAVQPPLKESVAFTTTPSAGLEGVDYVYRYKLLEEPTWTVGPLNSTGNFEISNLEECATYEMQIQAVCDSLTESPFSSSLIFSTDCDCAAPTNIRVVDSTENVLVLAWDAAENADRYQVLAFDANNPTSTNGIQLSSDQANANIFALESCESYQIRVQSVCATTQSVLSDTLLAKTQCPVSVTHLPTEISQLDVFPNPFLDNFWVEIELEQPMSVSVQLFNVSGKVIQQLPNQFLSNGVHQLPFEGLSVPSGVYFLNVQTARGQVTQRLVKL